MNKQEYKCQSYYDDSVLRDCSCGQCDKKIEKIYGSTEYIEKNDIKVGVLKLFVISQWDWKTKITCFQESLKTFGGGTMSIPFSLKRCIYVSEDRTHAKWEKVKRLTQEMKDTLIESGYLLTK